MNVKLDFEKLYVATIGVANFPPRLEILKSQLATEFTLSNNCRAVELSNQNDCGADFSQILTTELTFHAL